MELNKEGIPITGWNMLEMFEEQDGESLCRSNVVVGIGQGRQVMNM